MSKASKNQGFSAGRALGLATSRADAVEEENATLRARLAALTAAPPPAPPAPAASPPAPRSMRRARSLARSPAQRPSSSSSRRSSEVHDEPQHAARLPPGRRGRRRVHREARPSTHGRSALSPDR